MAVVEAVEQRRLLAELSGVVYEDADANGRYSQEEEVGVAGQVVWADYNYDGTMNAGEPSVVTSRYGVYDFPDLPLTGFALRLKPSLDVTQVTPSRTQPIYVGVNGDVLWVYDRDFGVRATTPRASLSGTAYRDVNENGRRDVGEPAAAPPGAGFHAAAYLDLDGDLARDFDEPAGNINPWSGAYTIRGVPVGRTYTLRMLADYADVRGTQPAGLGGTVHHSVTVISPDGSGGHDFGFTDSGGVVSAAAFEDLNGNGVQEPNEFPIGRAWIDVNRDGVRQPDEPWMQPPYFGGGHPPDNIDSLGSVRLPFGAWRLALDATGDGISEQFRDVSISAAARHQSVEFVVPKRRQIAGLVFADANGNGRRDAGEAGVAGQTVFADYNYNDAVNAGEPTAVTDAQGRYDLTVTNRSFALRLRPSEGSTQTSPAGNAPIFVAAGPHGQPVYYQTDFGVRVARRVDLEYFDDRNANGMRDAAEPSLDLATYGYSAFIDVNGDAVYQSGTDLSVSSDATGHGTTSIYFELPAGTYRLVSTRDLLAGESVTTGLVRTITVSSQDQRISIGIGNKLIEVRGSLFIDENRNGEVDGNEDGVPVPAHRVFADFDGDGVPDVDEPSVLSQEGTGLFRLGASRAFTPVVVLAAGEVQTVSAALPYPFARWGIGIANAAQRSGITGVVYADHNGNGRRDAGEAGVAGWTVFADYNYDGVVNTGEPTAVTAADGRYSINVDNVSFALRLMMDRGATQTSPAGERPIFVAAGANGQPVYYQTDFGVKFEDRLARLGIKPTVSGSELPPESYHRYEEYFRSFDQYAVWIDVDADGIRDANEALIEPRVTGESGDVPVYDVELVAGRAYTVALAKSDAIGAVASYTKQVTAPDGAAYYREVPLEVAPIVPVIAGVIPGYSPSVHSSGGRIWADYDGDGVIDGDEPTTGIVWSDYGLRNGAFYLKVPAGRAFTLRTDIVLTGGRAQVDAARYTLSEGQVRYGAELRLGASEVSGFVFQDLNGDGRRQAGEPPLAGHTVWADYDYDGTIDADEPTVESQGWGGASYGFPGGYRLPVRTTAGFALRVKPATGFVQTSPAGDAIFVAVRDGKLVYYASDFGIKPA